MPTWDKRDCINLSMCVEKNGNDTDSSKPSNVFDDAGTCVCGDTSNFELIGFGATARCIVMNSIDDSLEVLIQADFPYTWERHDVKDTDGNSKSIGCCHSERAAYYFGAMALMHGICMFVALVISWMTKDIPSDFADISYIFLSVKGCRPCLFYGP